MAKSCRTLAKSSQTLAKSCRTVPVPELGDSEVCCGPGSTQIRPDPGQVLPDQTLRPDPDLSQTNSGVCWVRKVKFGTGF